MKKRIVALLLALVLALSLLPIPTLAAEASTPEAELRYELAYDGSAFYAVITGYTGTASELTIPSEIGGHVVKSIGESAFQSCKTLKSVKFPDSLTELGKFAFFNCTGLTSVTIPAGVTHIPLGAFDGCKNLTEVTLPDGLTGLDSYAFSGCKKLKQVTIPEGVKFIGHNTFYDCSALTEITVPASVTLIGNDAFLDCSGLKAVTLQEGLTTIGYRAFMQCKALKSVKLPASITSIDDYAFMDCTGLSEIVFCGDAPDFGYDVFRFVTATVYYPGDNSTWTESNLVDHGGKLTWVPYTALPFSDVSPEDFCYEPVAWAMEHEITTGTSDSAFSPDATCSRAQAVTFLWRAAGCPEPAAMEHPFVDVETGSFYEKAVLWAVETGITTGTDATHFSPNSPCNRATVVTLLYRAFERPAFTPTGAPFSDVPTGSWYTAPVLWAVEQGITNGMGDGTFGANTPCNRAQIVTFLYRAYN